MPDAVQQALVRGCVMSNYVLKYSRGSNVRYISHLDFVRFMHRVIRRAGLPMEFSQGFNPHPIMTVAMPLSVGVTSDCEYMKIGFAGDFSEEYLVNTLNNAMPYGFKILAAKKDENKKYDFKKLNRAEYIVNIETDSEISVEEFMQNKELLVMKKSKSGIKETDIRPYIYDIQEIRKEDGCLTLKMRVASGNEYNLKPENVIDAMKKYIPGFEADFFLVHRAKILAQDEEFII